MPFVVFGGFCDLTIRKEVSESNLFEENYARRKCHLLYRGKGEVSNLDDERHIVLETLCAKNFLKRFRSNTLPT